MSRSTLLDEVKGDLEADPLLLLEDIVVQTMAQQLVTGFSVEPEIPFKEYASDPVGFIENVLGEKLTEQQKKVARSFAARKVTNVQSCNGAGKCVAQNELIPLASGVEVPAKDLAGKEFELFTLVDGVQTPVKAIADWNQVETVYEIVTASGRKIVRNAQHPLWMGVLLPDGSVDSRGWMPVSAFREWMSEQDVGVVLCAVPQTPPGYAFPLVKDEELEPWQRLNAHPGTIWERVESITPLDSPEMTVAIEVPTHHTYLTHFFEHNSFLSARLTIWIVFAVGGLCVSTAPTEGQLKEILWSEIRKCYQKNAGKLGGSCRQLSLRFSEWARAYGFVARDYDANAFQGKHGHKLYLILEEACGISREIDEAAEACVTGSENRLLRVGNPISDNTPFADACGHSSIVLNAWGHPNCSWAYEIAVDGQYRLKPEVRELIIRPEYQAYYEALEEGKVDVAEKLLPNDLSQPPVLSQDEWDESLPKDRVPGAISIAWVEEQRLTKGENSAFWQQRIEGLFSEDTESSLVPRTWFRAARRRYDDNPRYWDALASNYPARHGLDVGDGGDDHAYALWRGPVLYACEERATINDRQDISRAADWGWSKLKQFPHGTIVVDRVGSGAGALSDLIRKIQSEHNTAYQAIGYSAGSRDKGRVEAKYINSISQDLWHLREDFRQGEIAIAPLGGIEDRLEEELAKTYWDTNSKDQIYIEEKKHTKKRLKGRSPDRRDAVVMARSFSRRSIQAQSQSGNVSIGPRRAAHSLVQNY